MRQSATASFGAVSTVWSVPSHPARYTANSSSPCGWKSDFLKFSLLPSYSNEYVDSFSPDALYFFAANAVSTDESSPPERNVQSGTSLTVWRSTASLISSETSSAAVPAVPDRGFASSRQYSRSVSPPSSLYSPQYAGFNSSISLNIPLPDRVTGVRNKKLPQPLHRHLAAYIWIGKQRLHFRGENKPFTLYAVKNGFTPSLSRAKNTVLPYTS